MRNTGRYGCDGNQSIAIILMLMMDNTEIIHKTNVERIKWVDDLKGIILIMICLGHLSGMVSTPPMVKYVADVFTIMGVPAFFFLSGMLYKAGYTEMYAFLVRKTKSLLVPYILLSLLFTILDPYTFCPQYLIEILNYPRLQWLGSFGLGNYLQSSIEFFAGDIVCTMIGISSRATLPLWFVFVLYFVTIAHHFLALRIKFQSRLAIIAVGSYFVAIMLSYFALGGYMKIGAILMAFFFYWGGTICSGLLKYIFGLSLIARSGIIIVLLFAFFYLAPSIVDEVSFVNGVFPVADCIVFLVFSISGILSLVLLFKGLSRMEIWGFDLLKGVFRNIARNSLIVLATHYWALVVFHLFLSLYFPYDFQMYGAIVFVVLACIASIVIFRTRLYMFIGGERAYQDLYTCLSIK